MINEDLIAKADRINELLKSKSVTDYEKKCIIKMVGYKNDFVCVRLDDWRKNSFLCGPIVSGPFTFSTYFDVVIGGRIGYYLKIVDNNTQTKTVQFYSNRESNDGITPTIIFRLIKFATLIMNSIGVKAKKICLFKGEIPDEYIPKNIFSKPKIRVNLPRYV
jgi:hypothetical protein